MSLHERPRLRPDLEANRDPASADHVFVWDQRGLSEGVARITVEELRWATHFTGSADLVGIQQAIEREGESGPVSVDRLADLVRRLDEAYLLASERFLQRFAYAPEREPSCVPCYGETPDAIRSNLRKVFTSPGGPGMPQEGAPKGRLRAALVPHMDYARGGVTYGWGFKEIAEQTDARLFVIIATSHYSPARFTLTRQNFRSPLGVVPTDQAFIDRLVALHGPGLFDDPFAHIPEHSIELEVVMLQYLFEGRRPFRIVPLLVGSFHDCLSRGGSPAAQKDIGRLVAALRQVAAEVDEPICTIISGDLAHIGPKFGDRPKVHEAQLTHCRRQDQALIQEAAAVNPTGYFDIIRAEHDQRRICGVPPTITALEAFQPSAGRLVHYNQYVHPRGFECVSFASMAFDS